MKDREQARKVNERILLLTGPFADIGGETTTDFVCECRDERCFGVVPLTHAEWKAATAEPGYSVVRPQHVAPGEQAVIATGRYAVVRLAQAGEPTHRSAPLDGR